MESRRACCVPAFRDGYTAIGVGPLTADALVATIGDGREFSHGRQLSAWLGLTPTQHSSGGKTHLGQISCRGDGYLRTLLIQGARSSLQRAKAVQQDQANAEQIWIRSLSPRLPFGKVLVAKVVPSHDTVDLRAWAKPMNERGLRVRFLQWSGSASMIQQDRLRKCSLATLAHDD